MKSRRLGSLKLAKYLEEKQFAKMEFVGVSTHLCVLSNAILAQAACPNARICIDARCVASPTESDQKRALLAMQALHMEVLAPKEWNR